MILTAIVKGEYHVHILHRCCYNMLQVAPYTLTCSVDEAVAHSVACSAGTHCGKGTARWAYRAGCAPAGWQTGTVAKPLAAGPRGRSPVHARSCSGTAGSMYVHTVCPRAEAVAVDICGTPTHHPPHPGTHKRDNPDSHGTAHTLCTHVTRSNYPVMPVPSAPPWSSKLLLALDWRYVLKSPL